MHPSLFRIFLVVALSLCAAAQDAPAPQDPSPHSDATLISEVASVRPGQKFTVGLLLTMDKGWHSYWMNPGDSGTATAIQWRLPKGFTAAAIQWPYPKRLELPPLVTYGYEDEVLLLVDLAAPASLTGSTVTLAGKADWLICADICLPATADVALTLPVGEGAADATNKPRFGRARAMLPQRPDGWDVTAQQADGKLQFTIRAPADSSFHWQQAQFFAADPATINHATRPLIDASGSTVRIVTDRSEYTLGKLQRLRGVLVLPAAKGEKRALWLEAPFEQVAASAIAAPAPTPLAPDAAAANVTLVPALGLAFAGGLLLNLMPCIFPVLSLKVLHIVQSGGGDPGAVRKHGLAFMAGVVVLFWALTAALLALRAGGEQLGWGFQLQSPAFVAAIALLLFALGLNLLGVFEIGLSLTAAAAPARASSGYVDSFMSGALVTVVATPCTAPFMGVAMGFALAQSAPVAMMVFTALALGLAAPYVALTSAPRLLDRLPRPGAWMQTFKQAMAFPLFATVIWLWWVFGLQTDITSASYLLVALLLSALAAWIWGRWSGSHRELPVRRVAAAATALLVMASAATLVHAARRTPDPALVTASATKTGNDWQPYSSMLLEEYRAAGRPVFVDFTAAWCITCQVNKRVTLNSDEIHAEFARRNVALVKADWTRRDAEITEALRSFGRSGVPLYVLYYGDGRAPRILPEVLTRGVMLEALAEIPPRQTSSR